MNLLNLKNVKGHSIIILLSLALTSCRIETVTAFNKTNNFALPVTPCVTTATPSVLGSITLSAEASRLSGVAPLAVFFDATCTTSTATTRPFHELEYTWSFGDSGVSAGSWAQGAALGSKNAAKGPLAAHVFETHGTYIVTLTVIDGTSSVSNSGVTTSFQITVQDPDAVFASKTRCFHNSLPLGPGAGVCPGVESQTSGDASADVKNAISAGFKRMLFKRGDSFASSAGIFLGIAGPGTLGAYGAAASAIPVITDSTPTANDSVIRVNGASDWRIMDLSLADYGSQPNQKCSGKYDWD